MLLNPRDMTSPKQRAQLKAVPCALSISNPRPGPDEEALTIVVMPRPA